MFLSSTVLLFYFRQENIALNYQKKVKAKDHLMSVHFVFHVTRFADYQENLDPNHYTEIKKLKHFKEKAVRIRKFLPLMFLYH